VAECQKRHIGVTLPLTKVQVWKLRFFGSWDSQAKVVFLHKILGRVVGEESLQHLLGRCKVAYGFVTGLKVPGRLVLLLLLVLLFLVVLFLVVLLLLVLLLVVLLLVLVFCYSCHYKDS
jgi:hypothetical protein